MRLFVMILTILVLSDLVSAECREKGCMTNEFEFDSTGHIFYYNAVFDIGTNWYIIFDYPESNNNDSIEFAFDLSHSLVIANSSGEKGSPSQPRAFVPIASSIISYLSLFCSVP